MHTCLYICAFMCVSNCVQISPNFIQLNKSVPNYYVRRLLAYFLAALSKTLQHSATHFNVDDANRN